jgi:hypothetical protein
MEVLIAIDSSPASQLVLEEVAARTWPSNTAFCIVSAAEAGRFSELPALVADAKRECEQLVKAGAALSAMRCISSAWNQISSPPKDPPPSRRRTCAWNPMQSVLPMQVLN